MSAFKPYFSEWLVRQYFAGWWLLPCLLLTPLLLSGCGEAASCWNDIKGRFTSCEDMRRDEIDKRLDERERERSKSSLRDDLTPEEALRLVQMPTGPMK